MADGETVVAVHRLLLQCGVPSPRRSRLAEAALDTTIDARLITVTKQEKLLLKLLRGTSDASIGFEELRLLLQSLGFQERVRGSHFIFTRDDIAEIINLQPRGSQAKPYQVKQVRNLILQYRLGGVSDA